MDAQSLVVWNMGAIANSDHPDALELFQEVVLASSSIPAAFPPVFINVEVDGQHYDEMHTDGGTVTQVFFNEGTVDLNAAARATGRTERKSYSGILYIIRNGKLGPEPEQVKRHLPEITEPSMPGKRNKVLTSPLKKVTEYQSVRIIGKDSCGRIT